MQKLALALVATLIVGSAGAAAANNYRVRISDLDLATPQDAARFDQRIRRQAARACVVTGRRVPDARCMGDFREEVLNQMSDRLRQDYARARSGGPVSARTPAPQN